LATETIGLRPFLFFFMRQTKNIMLGIVAMASIATLIYVLPALCYGIITVSISNYFGAVSHPAYAIPMIIIALIGMIGAVCYLQEKAE